MKPRQGSNSLGTLLLPLQLHITAVSNYARFQILELGYQNQKKKPYPFLLLIWHVRQKHRTKVPHPLFFLPTHHSLLEPRKGVGWRRAYFQHETEHICGIRILHLVTEKNKVFTQKIKEPIRADLQGKARGQAEGCITVGLAPPLPISLFGAALSHAHTAPLCNLPCAERGLTIKFISHTVTYGHPHH